MKFDRNSTALVQARASINRGPVDSGKDFVANSALLREAGQPYTYTSISRRERYTRDEALEVLGTQMTAASAGQLLCQAEVLAGIGGGEATAGHDTILVTPS
jgi:hypothetical protein